MNELNVPAKEEFVPSDGPRRPWIVPELRTMRAGSAEAGPNPVNPEGIFAVGTS